MERENERSDEIGGFDARFFLYFEETDLCKRTLDANWQLWAVGEAVPRHVDGSSATGVGAGMFNGCIAEHFFQSRFYYLVKHHGRFAAGFTELAILAARGLSQRLRGRPAEDFAARMQGPVLQQPEPYVAHPEG